MENAEPDPRDGLRRFVDSLPWCVDFDVALTQLVKLAVGALDLGSFRIHVRNQAEGGFGLRKGSLDERAEDLGHDSALVRFFEETGRGSLMASSRSDAAAGVEARAELEALQADAAFAFRAQGELEGLALARSKAPGEALDETVFEALELAVSEFDRVAPELMQAERAALRGRMSGGVAHDLRSCFVSVSTLLQICAEEPPSLERIKELLPSARTNLETAREIIAQTQVAGRLDVFRGQPVDLGGVIGRAVDLAEPDLRAAAVAVEIDAGGGMIVAGVEVLLVRLVRNLLSNAISASPQGGAVRIGAAAESDGACAQVSVADEGEGMSDDIRRAALFRRPLDSPDGEGLGLAICREIASFHGGDFFIDNGGECGTIVRVSLPMWRGKAGRRVK